jgi:GH15 family glucan-1,4-alpha-glucosidase
MEGYRPIAEHGLIGDLQTAALVTTDGTVDWWCCPRFDSPSVFASLLDSDNGGRCRIGPEGVRFRSTPVRADPSSGQTAGSAVTTLPFAPGTAPSGSVVA